MTEDKQDALIRASVTLSSLRKNIDQIGAVPERYVDEFHSVIDKLTGIGLDVSEFRIQDSEVKPRITSKHMGGR